MKTQVRFFSFATAHGSDTGRIARDIDEFNAINKEITLAMGVTYLDITPIPISREARTDISLVAPDGLHPSESSMAAG